LFFATAAVSCKALRKGDRIPVKRNCIDSGLNLVVVIYRDCFLVKRQVTVYRTQNILYVPYQLIS